MSKNITTRIAAGAAAAGLAAAMVAVGGGAASAAPITGSADSVAGFVNDLGLFPVPKHEGLEAPGQTVTVNEDGTVKLAMTNPNTGVDGFVLCGAEIVPALEVGDGNPLGVKGALADTSGELGPIYTDTRDLKSGKLDPGVYAVISGCGVWDSQADAKAGKAPNGITAKQPHFFVTLGGLL